ncbi:MAG: glycosyltransferase family 4 protein [Anaerolineaceae bacterium]|nr:glycosyltransferase family 4 protein [Anaerolineaceae bacterium]
MNKKINQEQQICMLPKLEGVGGPSSFYSRMVTGCKERNISISNDPLDSANNAILVIGGTRRMIDVWKAKRNGVRVVQRLNGMNWIHLQTFTGIRHFFRAERNNFLLSFIRKRIASKIVYQSNFNDEWWNRVYGSTQAHEQVIYNGVDLNAYTPNADHERPKNHYRILIVEGKMGGGHEYGIRIGYQLSKLVKKKLGIQVEMVVAGYVPEETREAFQERNDVEVKILGILPRERVPFLDRSSHLMYTAELNAACPNSVIESMACGLPVIGFETGSIAELLGEKGGKHVPYGGNHWKLESPDITALADAACEVLMDQESFRIAARERAEALFDVNKMVEGYIEALLG